jgi:hypothetical protein
MPSALGALVAGLAVAGGATAITGGAQAQPYGYYPNRSADYGYRYEPPRAYDNQGRYTPYSYYNGYEGYGGGAGYAAIAAPGGALPGAVAASQVLSHAHYDRYGPDPNGLPATDGHRIKCKLVASWDSRRNAYRRQRECW